MQLATDNKRGCTPVTLPCILHEISNFIWFSHIMKYHSVNFFVQSFKSIKAWWSLWNSHLSHVFGCWLQRPILEQWHLGTRYLHFLLLFFFYNVLVFVFERLEDGVTERKGALHLHSPSSFRLLYTGSSRCVLKGLGTCHTQGRWQVWMNCHTPGFAWSLWLLEMFGESTRG